MGTTDAKAGAERRPTQTHRDILRVSLVTGTRSNKGFTPPRMALSTSKAQKSFGG
jgi:hypothetical protein